MYFFSLGYSLTLEIVQILRGTLGPLPVGQAMASCLALIHVSVLRNTSLTSATLLRLCNIEIPEFTDTSGFVWLSFTCDTQQNQDYWPNEF